MIVGIGGADAGVCVACTVVVGRAAPLPTRQRRRNSWAVSTGGKRTGNGCPLYETERDVSAISFDSERPFNLGYAVNLLKVDNCHFRA